MAPSKKPTLDEVNEASDLYARCLNGQGLTPVIQDLLTGNVSRPGFVAAPYMFFNRDGFDYESKQKKYDLVSSFYVDSDSTYMVDLDNVEESYDELSGRIADSMLFIFEKYGIGTKHTKFAGMMGVKIYNMAANQEVGDHYVAYIYDDGKFEFFDSGAPATCKAQAEENNTFIILHSVIKRIAANNKHKLTSVCNTGTFETAAGVSEDEYNYVGQNIFCHSWSLWFLYQRIVLGRSMAEVNKMAGKGEEADKDNLLLIKTFIYTYMIPKAGLSSLYCDKNFQGFTYYIDNPPQPKSKRATVRRTVKPIPGLPDPFLRKTCAELNE
jgi:hypothetical protein